jgi:hypothetical protein
MILAQIGESGEPDPRLSRGQVVPEFGGRVGDGIDRAQSSDDNAGRVWISFGGYHLIAPFASEANIISHSPVCQIFRLFIPGLFNQFLMNNSPSFKKGGSGRIYSGKIPPTLPLTKGGNKIPTDIKHYEVCG